MFGMFLSRQFNDRLIWSRLGPQEVVVLAGHAEGGLQRGIPFRRMTLQKFGLLRIAVRYAVLLNFAHPPVGFSGRSK